MKLLLVFCCILLPILLAGQSNPGTINVSKIASVSYRLSASVFEKDQTGVITKVDSSVYIYSNGRLGNYFTEIKYDTSYSFVMDTSGFMLNHKFIRTYDINDNVTEYNWEKWHDNQWNKYDRQLFTYTPTDKMATWLFQDYDSINNVWKNKVLRFYNYNIKDLLDTIRTQESTSGVLVDQSRVIYDYDTLDQHIKLTVQANYSGYWASGIRILYTYTNNGLLYSNQTDIDAGFWLTVNRQIYQYDSLDNLINRRSEQHGSSGWDTSYHEIFEYNNNNDLIRQTRQNYVNGSWINSFKDEYTFNSLGEVDTFSRLAWDGNQWNLDWRYIFWYEYIPQTDDVSITSIVEPLGFCGDSSSAVVIKLSNPGLNPQSNIPIVVTYVGQASGTLVDTFKGTIQSGQSVNLTVGNVNTATAGTYIFKAYTQMSGDLNLINDTAFITLNINSTMPNASFTGPIKICIDDAPIDMIPEEYGGAFSGPGISNAIDGTFDPSIAGAGTFTVVYSITKNGCTAEDSINVTVSSEIIATADSIVPSDNYTSSNGKIFLSVNGGTPPYTYNWSNGAISKDLSGLATGNYTVTITDNNGCESVSTYIVPLGTGIYGFDLLKAVELYPNPSIGTLNVYIKNGNSADIVIEVHDVLGKQFLVRSLKTRGEHIENFDLRDLASGSYMMIITINGTMVTKKFFLAD